MNRVIYDLKVFTEEDIYLFKEGTHYRLYEKLGAHVMEYNGREGVYFAVWAPNAELVSVIGDFNNWNPGAHKLAVRWDGSGIWEGFIPGIKPGDLYKFHICSRFSNYSVAKSDPFAFLCESPPGTASKVYRFEHTWNDHEWMKKRRKKNNLHAPISIYEVHLGSWRKIVEDGNRSLSYREVADYLIEYIREMGFTHVEFMPLMEHPFYGSWGYQITNYFAPTSRFGVPEDLMYLIDKLHQNDIGVILDWVPSHFPDDEHGLAFFDGTFLYEHADPKKGVHPDWKSRIFNYGRNEVRAFLLSNAIFWLDKYHADGLRVDAVASMLYLDYSRKEGEWVPNRFGGRENLEAIEFLKKLNEVIYQEYPDVITIAEESTAWPMVSRPTYLGGLGFGMKWNMGWMHDILNYFSKDPIFRKYHHNNLTFPLWYAFNENFILPLSHDEVVYGKGSLFQRMPGDEWQKFANLRLLFGLMSAHPGKKLLFMGNEFGQRDEWNHERSLDWHLLGSSFHRGLQLWVKDLNRTLKREPALYDIDFESSGFEWIDFSDQEQSVISFMRKGKNEKDRIILVANFTPIPRYNYRIGAPEGGKYIELLNSDAKEYGGSGIGNLGSVTADDLPFHGRNYSLSLTLPPLGIIFLKGAEK